MKALIIILSVHIFSVHSKLLYYLNPELTEKASFSYTNLNEATILAMIFALSYSVATALAIYNTNNKRITTTYAILDAIGVLLYYFTAIPMLVTSFYFAIYTFVLINSVISVNSSKKAKPVSVEKQMKQMVAEGIPYKEIAEKFNTSVATVSRRINSKK